MPGLLTKPLTENFDLMFVLLKRFIVFNIRPELKPIQIIYMFIEP